MLAVKRKVHVDATREVTIRLPENLPPGEYDLVVVIDNSSSVQTSRRLTFADYTSKESPSSTFRREDIYEEDDR